MRPVKEEARAQPRTRWPKRGGNREPPASNGEVLGTEDPAGLWVRGHGRDLVLEAGPGRTFLRQGLDGGAVPGGPSGKAGILEAGPPRVRSRVL